MTLGQMENVSSFDRIYPEWSVSREMRMMEKKEKRKRERKEVLRSMKDNNQEPLRICMNCDKTCIQRKVVGLTMFKCFERAR